MSCISCLGVLFANHAAHVFWLLMLPTKEPKPQNVDLGQLPFCQTIFCIHETPTYARKDIFYDRAVPQDQACQSMPRVEGGACAAHF